MGTGAPAPRPPPPTVHHRGRIEAEVGLYAEISGDGPVVCLAHGFGGSARNWRPQVRGLAPRYRCAVFDARGHGRSDAPPEAAAYRPPAWNGDFARVLDRAGAARAVVGGLSMGAGLALRFALHAPDRVRALILAAFPPSSEGGRGASWPVSFAAAIDREGLEAAGAHYIWGPTSGFDPRSAAMVRAGFLEHTAHGIAHTLRELLARQPSVETLAPQLADLPQPTLVLVGGHDRLSLSASEALARALPGAELAVVPGAGHVVNLERRQAVNDILRDFLARVHGEPEPPVAAP